MDKADLVKLVGWRLGDRDDLALRIDAELDVVQDLVLEGHVWLPWFLQKEAPVINTVAGVQALTLPEDFLAEVEERAPRLYDATLGRSKELVKVDLDIGYRQYSGQGQPQVYAFAFQAYQLLPVPDQVYPIYITYYAKDVRLNAENVTSLWLKYAADVVLAELCQIIARNHIKDPEAAAGFAQDAQVAWKRLYDKHVSILETNHPRALGGNT
jgi:hypothetical protein